MWLIAYFKATDFKLHSAVLGLTAVLCRSQRGGLGTMKLGALVLAAATSLLCLTNAEAAEITCISKFDRGLGPAARLTPEERHFLSGLLLERFPSGRVPTPETCKEALIKGVIEPGDGAKFAAFLHANHPFLSRIYLWSPGGSVEEAMKIGRLVRKGMLATKVADDFLSVLPPGHGILFGGQAGALCQGSGCHCASACFLIWAAGIVREGNVLGLHRPSVQSTRFANLPPEQASASYRLVLAEMERYLAEMEVPRRFIELMTDTASNDVRWLDFNEGWSLKEVASIAEWITASCGTMSKSDEDAIFKMQTEGLEKPLSDLGLKPPPALLGQALSRDDKAKLIERKREVDSCTFNKIENARDAISEIVEANDAPRRVTPRVKTQAAPPPRVPPRPAAASPPPATAQTTMPNCWDVAGITRVLTQANPGIEPAVLVRAIEKYQIMMGCRPAPQTTQCAWIGTVWTCRTQ
jgi:hypothetical protein